MALLAEFGTLIGQLPADPLSDIVFAARVLRVEPSGFSARYIMIGPDSKIVIGAAAHRLVVEIAGIRLFGEIFKNSEWADPRGRY